MLCYAFEIDRNSTHAELICLKYAVVLPVSENYCTVLRLTTMKYCEKVVWTRLETYLTSYNFHIFRCPQIRLCKHMVETSMKWLAHTVYWYYLPQRNCLDACQYDFQYNIYQSKICYPILCTRTLDICHPCLYKNNPYLCYGCNNCSHLYARSIF